MKRSGASCGLSFTCPPEIFSALQVTTDSGYDFLVTPIVHPRFRARSDMKRNYAFTRSDLILSSTEWSSLVVGVVSRHLSLESPNASVRRDAEDALQRELNFASHLGKSEENPFQIREKLLINPFFDRFTSNHDLLEPGKQRQSLQNNVQFHAQEQSYSSLDPGSHSASQSGSMALVGQL